jgi:hypothetical protein
MIWIVYEVWDVAAGQPFYVGKGTDVVEREKQHLKAAARKKNGPAFLKKLRAMRETGQAYEFRVVFKTTDEAAAFAKEAELIALYGRRDLGSGLLLNHTDGGQGASGWVPRTATRELWSEQRTGRPSWNDGKRYHHRGESPKKGKPWSDVQRAQHAALTPEQKAARLAKRRATLAAKGGARSPAQIAAARLHSERMKGAANPHFGVPGWNAGQKGTGPWLGKSTPIAGRRKGPDGTFYTREDFISRFGFEPKS